MNRKYVIIVPDGAADRPIPELGGKTIFEAAEKQYIDSIALNGIQGTCSTVPPSLQPGSDVAMMAVLGYDPIQCYTGRAPIEAEAQGINVTENDWIFRCNLVTTAEGKMLDHSSGHITSEEGKAFVEDLNNKLGNENIKFYPGVGYRHLMIITGGDFSDMILQPPHDNIGIEISKLLPQGKNSEVLTDLIKKSESIFKDHKVNIARRKLGKREASSIWLWGRGRKAKMESFANRYGLKGAAITAVDLVKGLARLIGFDYIKVEGATGYFDTNYRGKGLAAIEALKKYDIVLVHVEATDEAGHAGDASIKKKALEQIDRHIVGPVMMELKKFPSWRILVMPDHPTSVLTKGHSGEPVPFAMTGDDISGDIHLPLSESNAAKTGISFGNGCELMKSFLKF